MAWEQSPNPQGYSKDWKTIRQRFLQRANFRCALNLKGCTTRATEVDHINGDVENNDRANLRALCHTCHVEVTRLNRLEALNRQNPRQEPVHPATLVEDVEQRVQAIKQKEQKKAEVVDDLPSNDEDDWIISYGPVFAKTSTGSFIMPKRTLGIIALKWMMENLQINGKPWKPTMEQARIIMWMYSLQECGRWEFYKTLHIAPKGSGKDPFGAALCCLELAGPSRFSHWDTKGNPVARRQEDAWVQVAAVSLIQNENTFRYIKGMFNDDAKKRYQIEELTETIYAFGRRSKIESISNSGTSREGNQTTFAMISEGQHWLESNGCHALFRVLTRNLTKVNNSHYYMPTNAYNPNQNSIAQQQFEAWEDSQAGITKPSKTLVVARMATLKAPWDTMEERIKVLNRVYGSSTAFTNVVPLAETFDDKANPVTESLRFYYNLVGVQSDAYLSTIDWDRCVHPKYDKQKSVPAGTRILLAADLSKNDDSTAVVAIVCEGPLSGMLFVAGIWEKPRHLKGDVADSWEVPREEIDATVRHMFKNYRVQGFWVDPSHKMDSEGGGSYWKPLLNQWHKEFSRKIPPSMWAKGSEHSINWDMASHANQRDFTDNVSSFETEVIDGTIFHDGDPDLRRHIQNARRYKSRRFGETIKKESPRSNKKIDAAVTAIIAYTMFNKYMTNRRSPARRNQTRTYTVPGRDN